MCLRRLHDEVPPMPASEVEAILKEELHLQSLADVFAWIDLDRPLGSASIAQVHKAQLRRYEQRPALLARAASAPWRLIKGILGA
jgi:predicted unusual protein kinase regulating ubiquinone biosynthesis (AarF/ABC1/UbiB family)